MKILRDRARLLLMVFASALLPACSSDIPTEPRMIVFMENLPSTKGSMVYELWSSNGEDHSSIKRFGTSTGVVSLSIPLSSAVNDATSLLVTLESSELVSTVPSETVLLAGDFIGDEAQLRVSDSLAMGTDFSTAYGTFRLDTPTTTRTTDFDQGIWWYDLVGDEPVQSLFLPALPSGWTYEGWVIGGDQPLSIGKFPDPARFDSDLAGAVASDDLTAPLFPGQDYISAPELIPGFSALVTVEPQPDNSPDPFDFEILIDQVIENIAVNQPMVNRTQDQLPSGSVRRDMGVVK